MSIICTGSIAYDYLMSFPGYFRDHIMPDKLDSISLSFLVDTMVRHRGGTATNIAYNLALLGERPQVMATAGVDFMEYRAWLEANNIDTTLIKIVPDVYTASFFVNTDLSNAQIATFYAGAMAYACELSLRGLDQDKPELVVISANDPGAMNCLVTECVELKIPYLYDPSQQIVRMNAMDLRRGVESAQSLFLNDYEFGLLQKHTGMSVSEIISHLEYMVITRGEDGAVVYADGKEYLIPIAKTEHMVEPTGVGDAFRGGFLRGQKLGLDWQTCGQMGSLSATYCLEQRGTQNHTYTIQEYVQRYRETFSEAHGLEILLRN